MAPVSGTIIPLITGVIYGVLAITATVEQIEEGARRREERTERLEAIRDGLAVVIVGIIILVIAAGELTG